MIAQAPCGRDPHACWLSVGLQTETPHDSTPYDKTPLYYTPSTSYTLLYYELLQTNIFIGSEVESAL